AMARPQRSPLSLHDALPISSSTHFSTRSASIGRVVGLAPTASSTALAIVDAHGPIGGSPMPRALNGPTPSPDSRTLTSISGQSRSEEHTSELQSRENLVCRL